MRRLLALAAITVIGLILVLTFRSRVPDAPAAQSPVASVSRPASSSSAPSTGPPALSAGTHTITGQRVSTAWGFVQVRIHTVDRRLVDVTALEVPHGNPIDVDINRDAVPQLRAEALAAQSAHIDTISGATVTSGGYLRSLQSALDRLGN